MEALSEANKEDFNNLFVMKVLLFVSLVLLLTQTEASFIRLLKLRPFESCWDSQGRS